MLSNSYGDGSFPNGHIADLMNIITLVISVCCLISITVYMEELNVLKTNCDVLFIFSTKPMILLKIIKIGSFYHCQFESVWCNMEYYNIETTI